VITIETTQTDMAEDIESKNRARHVAIVDGLGELADLLADAGPGADLTDEFTEFELRHLLWSGSDSAIDRMRRLVTVAKTLGAEITSDEAATGSTHYRATREFAGGAIKMIVTTIIDPVELDDAAAALAEAIAATGGAA